MTLSKLNRETLDLLEDRFVKGLLGEEEVSGTTLEILRRVLNDNGRITIGIKSGDPDDILGEDDAEEMDYPFPRLVNGEEK